MTIRTNLKMYVALAAYAAVAGGFIALALAPP